MYRYIFQHGQIVIHSYGVMIALGVSLASYLALGRCAETGMRKSDLSDLVIFMVLGGLLGGRLLYVLTQWHYFRGAVQEVFMFWHGGLAMQGALVGGLLAAAVGARVKRLDFLTVADLMAPYAALAQAFGRIGCFLNGCCYGRPAQGAFFAVQFPGDLVPRVPTQLLYSAALISLFLLLRFVRRRDRVRGRVLALYLMSFAVIRMAVDHFRGDELVSVGPLRLTQVLGVFIFLAGAVLYAVRTLTGARSGES